MFVLVRYNGRKARTIVARAGLVLDQIEGPDLQLQLVNLYVLYKRVYL